MVGCCFNESISKHSLLSSDLSFYTPILMVRSSRVRVAESQTRVRVKCQMTHRTQVSEDASTMMRDLRMICVRGFKLFQAQVQNSYSEPVLQAH